MKMKIDRRVSTAHQIYVTLRRRIMEFALAPGTIISKPAITEEFGVSQGPLRDALLRLEGEGLVDIMPQSKTTVSLIDVQHAREAHFLRLSVDIELVHVLATTINDAELAKLRAWIEHQVTELKAGDQAAFKLADNSFHAEMFRFAGVEGLTQHIHVRRGHYDRMRGLYLMDRQRREVAIKEHRMIVDALAAGNSDAARAAVRLHLSKSFAVVNEIRDAHPGYFS